MAIAVPQDSSGIPLGVLRKLCKGRSSAQHPPPLSEPSGVQGSWLRVAALMSSKPDLAIFRKFSKLNALRLLEMQSELLGLEQDFEDICELDAAEDCPITRSYQLDWEALNKSEGKGGDKQRDTWRMIRGKLESYSRCMRIFNLGRFANNR